MKHTIWFVIWLCLSLCSGIKAQHQEKQIISSDEAAAIAKTTIPSSSRAFVVQKDTLLVIDEADLAIKATLPLVPKESGKLSESRYGKLRVGTDTLASSLLLPLNSGHWFNDDGSRLAVVASGYFSVVDLATLTIVGQETLGREFPIQAIHTTDGKGGYLLCAGIDSKKPQEQVLPCLIAVDAMSGHIRLRRDLAQSPQIISLTENQKSVVLVYAGEESSKSEKSLPARVEFLDAQSLETRSTLSLPGPAADVQWSKDRSLLYVLDAGVDEKKPEKARPGHVYVIDLAEARLAAKLEIGIAPSPLLWDPRKQVFYILTVPQKAKSASRTLMVLEGERIIKNLKLAKEPFSIVPAPDWSSYYILDESGITIVDGEISRIDGAIPLSPPPKSLLFLESTSNAYVLHPNSSKVTAVDLKAQKVIASITTGRGGMKFANFLGAVAATTLSGIAAQAQARLRGQSYYSYTVYTVADAQTDALVSSDGKTAYIYNSQTNDVTVVDTSTHKNVLMFAGGSDGLFLVNGRKSLAAWGGGLTLVDTATQTLKPKVKSPPGFRSVCPDGRHVYCWSFSNKETTKRSLNILFQEGNFLWDEDLAVVDLETGTICKTFAGVRGPVFFRDLPKTIAK
jgi:hypothetical protein